MTSLCPTRAAMCRGEEPAGSRPNAVEWVSVGVAADESAPE